MKQYPALELRSGDVELLYAALDDFSPTAIEERDDGLRAFFLTPAERDAAFSALSSRFDAAPIEVPDDDWAVRSQQGLAPITVGRITIVPHQQSTIIDPQSTIVEIRPSMGFGTGHHATTRLCLAALQTIDLGGTHVLDVGTGSGVLAISARVLGAALALGIDVDPDAIQSATENLARNPAVNGVRFEVADLSTAALPQADVVTANLTGALLTRAAGTLLAATRPGGTLILSGLMVPELDVVVRAFAPPGSDRGIAWERREGGWVGLAVKKP